MENYHLRGGVTCPSVSQGLKSRVWGKSGESSMASFSSEDEKCVCDRL